MKKLPLPLLALCSALITLAPMRSEASVAVSFDFFYDELAPYGNWIDVDGYGYCFQPQVASGWRPYYNGDWIYTDAGWAWNSSESWGWATYHYGRWANVGGCGWVWVPGYEWAPAWVSWRTGGDYIGWAPLPPECGWNGSRISFGVSFGFDIGPSYYNFCSPRYFGYGNIGGYCAPWRNNVNIIQQTTNITNITNVVNNNTTIINSGGPNYDFVRQNSDRPIRRAKIERMTDANGLRKGGALKNDLRGDKLRVVSPKIANNKNAKPKTVAARASSKNVDRGWSDIKDPNRAKQLRENMKNEAKVAATRPGGQNRANTRDGQGAKARTGNAQNQSAKNNAQDNARKTAGNDRTKAGSGLKPFIDQEQNRAKSPAGRKQEQVRAERQQQLARDQRQKEASQAQRQQEEARAERQQAAAKDQRQQAQNQRPADARRNADADAARRQQQAGTQQQSRREQVLRQQAQYETARRQPQQQQGQRPSQARPQQGQSQKRQPQPLQRQGQPQQRPLQQQVQRPPQQQRQAQPQQRQQAQQRVQPSQQQRPAQSQNKKDDRPQVQRSSPSQMQRPPQRQSQPQMQRPQQPQRQSSPGGGGNRKSSNNDGRKRS